MEELSTPAKPSGSPVAVCRLGRWLAARTARIAAARFHEVDELLTAINRHARETGVAVRVADERSPVRRSQRRSGDPAKMKNQASRAMTAT